MMHIRFKYKVALSSIVIMMVMVTLTGFSYAYFTTQVSGEGNDIVVQTGDVLMNFTEGGKDINLTNQYPISDEQGLAQTPYTFNLSNPNAFPVKAYVFVNVLNESTEGLEPHINVAYNNGTDYTTKLLDTITAATTSPVTTGEKWLKVADEIYTGSTSYLIDTISLTAINSAGASKNDLKFLFWIDDETGGVQECTIDEATGTCTTTPDPSMSGTFKATISVVTVPDRANVQHIVSKDPPVESAGSGE